MNAPERLATVAANRPRWLTGAVVVDVVLIVFLSYLLYETTQLFGGARRFPIVTLPVTIGLLVLDLVLTLVPSLRRRLGFVERDYIKVAPAGSASADGEAEQQAGARQRVLSPWLVLLWLLALGLGMYFLGYAIMTPVFLVAFFLWVRVPLKVAAGITIVMSALNYLVFYQLLGYG
ncbi:MAG: hypothetical protein GEV07_12095 [Streptosporangiales bacterium]|nr:hypothetical protein [Streptosporangiales bacterium]